MITMTEKKSISKAKQTVSQVFNQAKESLRILQTLEKETLAKAKSFVRIPSATERNRLRNERILLNLKELGVATQKELKELQKKVHQLELSLQGRSKSSSGSTSKRNSKDTAHTGTELTGP
jgi:hypothetical protein